MFSAKMSAPIQAIAFDPDRREWLYFEKPRTVFQTTDLSQIENILEEVERSTSGENLWAVGWVSYEAAPAFDPSLTTRPESTFPKVWFATFEAPSVHKKLTDTQQCPILNWTPSVTEAEYFKAVHEIRGAIKAGDTYQTNFSFRLRSKDSTDPLSLFASMVRAQGGDYHCFIQTDAYSLASASPELFFKREGATLTCRPMKGTATRGCTLREDQSNAEELRASEKNRAENIMIVDMTRNDLGRIAERGSVRVPSVCSIEKYPHMYQMTSEVRAESSASLFATFQALFPAASITGAPKDETMRIIASLETTPRKIYTGSIGVITPEDRAWFNVAIRTALIDHTRSITEYGVGSGIVWDSTTSNEYQECLAKASAVTISAPPFDLFETILWEPAKGFFLRGEHLHRLMSSAQYFGRTFDRDKAHGVLEATHLHCAKEGHPQRVKLMLAPDGSLRTEAATISPLPSPYRVALAREPVSSRDKTLYHKTTNRRAYDGAVPRIPDAHDVILWNERGEITESRIANICLEIDGVLYTPPVESGLLAGCYRDYLLRSEAIVERALTVDDLQRATRIIFINSLRREWDVELMSDAQSLQNRAA